MKCEIVKDLIPLYCDGLCSEETKSAVKEHTAGCEDCRRLLEAAGADIEVPAQTYDEEEARVLQGVKKRYSRIRWRAVLLTVCIAAVLIAVVGGAYYFHEYRILFPEHSDVQLHRMEYRHDSLHEGKEAYFEFIMDSSSWSGYKKVRELELWTHGVDLEINYYYTAPYHIEASGEVKNGKTTLRYEGYVTTRDGETVEYKNEMTFDWAYGPEGKLFGD